MRQTPLSRTPKQGAGSNPDARGKVKPAHHWSFGIFSRSLSLLQYRAASYQLTPLMGVGRSAMLALSRKPGEKVVIGNDITLTGR